MPWVPSYSREQAEEAIARTRTWSEALRLLGLSVHGKNGASLRRWTEKWGIDTSHLPRQGGIRRYSEDEARVAIGASRSWAEALRQLGRCPTGGASRTLKKRAAEWGIDTTHFTPFAASDDALRRRSKPRPLHEVLVSGSSYSRASLKRRLYSEGLKEPVCELCGQGDIWRGKRMGLILDHINGVRDDHRLENLRIVCPNCAATLSTHCGRKNRVELLPRHCLHCEQVFEPRNSGQRYCSRFCGSRWDRRGAPRPGARKVERPPESELLAEIERHGYLETGRRYGVSDNAIRKWVRAYARERAVAEGRDPEVIEIPTRTWPNRRDKRRAA